MNLVPLLMPLLINIVFLSIDFKHSLCNSFKSTNKSVLIFTIKSKFLSSKWSPATFKV